MQTKNHFFHRASINIPSKCSSFTKQTIYEEILLIEAFQNVLDLQVNLINQLALNKNLIANLANQNNYQVLKSKNVSTDVGTEKIPLGANNNSGMMSQNPSCMKKENKCYQQKKNITKHKIIKGISKKISSGSCYAPSNQGSDQNQNNSSRQTKHIPKNYGKGIVNFILRNRATVEKVCQNQGKNAQQLLKVAQHYKQKLYTVAHLKSLWIDNQNEFARVFRILSMLYLRKYCVSYIFNSRVQNHSLHIKYRYRIIEGVKAPHTFNRIKEY